MVRVRGWPARHAWARETVGGAAGNYEQSQSNWMMHPSPATSAILIAAVATDCQAFPACLATRRELYTRRPIQCSDRRASERQWKPGESGG